MNDHHRGHNEPDERTRVRRAGYDFLIEAIQFTRRIVRSEREYERLGEIIREFEDRYAHEFDAPTRPLDRAESHDQWRRDIDVGEAQDLVRHFTPPFDGDRDLRR